MFVATTLIAVGIGGYVTIFTASALDISTLPAVFGVWYGAAAFIGAGVLAPFKKPIWGAAIGYLGMFGYALYLAKW